MKNNGVRRPREFRRLAEIVPPFKQRLYFVAILTKFLEKHGIRPIVVGGHAVEFYTLGTYATVDIDLVSQGTEIIGELLTGWGFVKTGRHWLLPELDIEIEIPSAAPQGIDTSRLTKARIEDLVAYIIGIEDLIIDRLNACVHWKSQADCEWAAQLLKLHKNKIDLGYLKERSRKEGIIAALTKITRNG